MTFVVIIVLILMFPCSIAMKGYICVGLLNYLFLLLSTTPNLASTISMRYVLSRFHECPVYLETGRLILGLFVCVLYGVALAVNVHFKRPHMSVFALQKYFLEAGLIFIASSMYTWHHTVLHLVAFIICQYGVCHQMLAGRLVSILFRISSYICIGMNIISATDSLLNFHILWFLSVLTLAYGRCIHLRYYTIFMYSVLKSYLQVCFVLSFVFCIAHTNDSISLRYCGLSAFLESHNG